MLRSCPMSYKIPAENLRVRQFADEIVGFGESRLAGNPAFTDRVGPGLGVEFKPESLAEYAYPNGPVWKARAGSAGGPHAGR